jgi:hypothetical protein
MGWGRMLLLGDWGQQMDIQDQQNEIANLRQEVAMMSGGRDNVDTSQRIAQLERENDELRLYLAALVRYLGIKGVVQKEEFRRLIDAVDAEDGLSDGGYKGQIG